MVQDLLCHSLGEWYETGFNRLVTLVFRVSDVIIELDYFLQKDEDKVSLYFLLTRYGYLLLSIGHHIITYIQILLQ